MGWTCFNGFPKGQYLDCELKQEGISWSKTWGEKDVWKERKKDRALREKELGVSEEEK